MKRELIKTQEYEDALKAFLPNGVLDACDAEVERAAKLAFSTVKYGRPQVPDTLVDWVASMSNTWRELTGKRPGKTRDGEGNYTGPFFDLLSALLAAYPFFQASRVTRTIIKRGLERGASKDN
ncbi:hypothetical protein [Caulobacter sp. S45]|uniref:hypothetical protein n=1 Tax=Caulobacter sp. S45 TaxID=1641861 RepID=UPI0015762597|nr:hypothetical protein [Caulobacter sp. S45]